MIADPNGPQASLVTDAALSKLVNRIGIPTRVMRSPCERGYLLGVYCVVPFYSACQLGSGKMAFLAHFVVSCGAFGGGRGHVCREVYAEPRVYNCNLNGPTSA